MASNVADSADVMIAPEHPRPAATVPLAWGVRSFVAGIAPVAAVTGALLVHFLVPNRQNLPMTWMDGVPDWQHPYPLFLDALLTVWLVAAAAQWLWPPLRVWVHHYGPLLAGFCVVLSMWELVTAKWAWMPQPYFPGPDEVLGALVEDREILLLSTWHSLRLLLTGYTVGVLAGFVAGVLIGWFRQARYWGTPVMKVLGPLPATALIPLVMLLFPRSYYGAAALIAFAVWFPVTMLTASGVANVRLSYLDVARTLGAGRRYLILHVAIPSALPNVFVGLFNGLGASFLTLVVAEGVGVEAGLGWYLQWQKGYADYAKVYASLLIMAAFFSTIMTLLFKMRDWTLKWQKGVIKW